MAYDANSSQRLSAGTSWTFENWEACFVCNGVVYDHIPYRLKGANGRYTASGTGGVGNGKRAFKFYFNKGYEFDAFGGELNGQYSRTFLPDARILNTVSVQIVPHAISDAAMDGVLPFDRNH